MANSLFRRPRITLVVIVLVSLSLLSVSYRKTPPFIAATKGYVRDVVTPIRQAVSSVVTPVYDVVAGAFEYGSVKKQNHILQNELALLKNQRVSDAGATNAMAALTAVLHIPFASNLKSMPAEVISYTPTNVQLSIELNKGSLLGVKVGNPVVSADGLIGRVVQVSSGTSTVLLVDDPNFTAGVRFGTTGQIGLLVGQGVSDRLAVQLVDPGTVLRQKQVVYTSGMQGEIFPPGLPVGEVAVAYTAPGALEEHVELNPMVDLSSLNYVSVLDWQPVSP